MNSTVAVKWSSAQNVRGLLQGYKVPLKATATLWPNSAPEWPVLAHLE